MIQQTEYRKRRQALAKEMIAESVAFIPAAQEVIRNGDAHYRFRQDSNLYYLTGLDEPGSLLVITAGENSQSILLNRPLDPAQEQWTGKRLGQVGAIEIFGMDLAYSIEDLEKVLPEIIAGKSAMYCALGTHESLQNRLMQILTTLKAQHRRGTRVPEALIDLEPLLSEMRLFKSKAEVELMERAAAISVQGHERAMRTCKEWQYEYQLEAELVHTFYQGGCRNVAYDSIVANGANACVLHYTDNNKPLVPGDLVLIDAGAEYAGYAADITRTFPVNGSFSEAQGRIYDLVLKAQRQAIAAIKPGLAWNRLQESIVTVLTQGLCDLGILQGDVKSLIAQEAYKPFYMHGSGHWLGLDVHDCGAYKIEGAWRTLEPGMVLTVEPGLYISPDTPGVDKAWWGIGVRIEDDVLVTLTGHRILTAALPVERDAIEALMRD